MSKSISKKYWRDFEHLCVELIVSQFRVKPDIIVVTKPTRDGGIDGIIKHQLMNPQFFDSENVTLLEAKLRSGRASIGLQVFATTLVVAFNQAASMLIVITNQRFSTDAYEQALRFKAKTNLRVILVEGGTLGLWISDNYETLAKNFPKALLDFLRPAEKTSDVLTSSSPEQGCVRIVDHDTTGFILTGKKENGSLAPCEIVIDNTEEAKTILETPLSLIGYRRKRIASNLQLAVSRSGGVALVKGTAGVGKSVVINQIVQNMRRQGRSVSYINLGHVIGSRQLFVKLLSELSGIDIAEAFGGKDEAIFATMLERVGGNLTPEAMRKAVQSVLSETFETHLQRRDLNEQLLIEYLERAVEPYSKRVCPAIICQDLNRSSREMLDFLLVVCQRLARVGVSFVIEARIEHHSDALRADEWAGYINSFRQIANLGEFVIEPLTVDEADMYLSELIPGFGTERRAFILKRVGLIPLFLYAASLWLKEHKIVSQSTNLTLIEELEHFFDGISPDQSTLVLRLVIEAAQQRYGSYFSDCIASTLFFGGKLEKNVIASIVPSLDSIEVAETLLASGIFTRSPQSATSVEVIHDLMIDEIRSVVSPLRLANVADRLLRDLNSLVVDAGHRKAVRAELLLAMNLWHQAFTEALECGRALASQRQWNQAARYLEMAYDSSQHFEKEQARFQFTVIALIELLEVECLRYRIGLDKNLDRLDYLATAFKFIGQEGNSNDWQQILLRMHLIQWRAEYVHENFAAALTTAEKAKTLALSMPVQSSIELRGKALTNYAVTLKVLDKRQESYAAFDSALKILPTSITVQAERLSNIAAFALRDNPQYARKCYQELLRIVDGTSYSFLEIIHAHVDMAMSSFLMCDYDIAEEEAVIALRLAESNGIPTQEGRAWNIIGCSHWARDSTTDAAGALDQAAFAVERAISRRFLWRIRTNCASVALELGNKDAAYHYAQSAEGLILEPRMITFPDLQSDTIHFTSRWYVALLVIAKCYHNLNKIDDLSRLLDHIALPRFMEHTQEFLVNLYPKDVFSGTTHKHGNRVMITG